MGSKDDVRAASVETPSCQWEPGKKRIGDWIQTFTGIRFHLLDPRPEDFDIEDIAQGLSNQCRFAGHTQTFYSVAEHSVRVAEAVRDKAEVAGFSGDLDRLLLSALMHDASDAYMLDMPRPFKYLPEFAFYKDAEHKLMIQIAAVFDFDYPKPELVGWADDVLLGTEARDLFDFNLDNWNDRYEKLSERIRPWPPTKARRVFLELYHNLMERRQS